MWTHWHWLTTLLSLSRNQTHRGYDSNTSLSRYTWTSVFFAPERDIFVPSGLSPKQVAYQAAISSGISEDRQAHSRTVAVVGAGSAGLGALKALFDLPEDLRRGWEILLFEARSDVGGIWLPDPNPPNPPHLPETPLYPLLQTNTPHPTMTYPHFTFPPSTPLFPRHEYVQRYHRSFSDYHNLTQHVKFGHEVVGVGWIGTAVDGFWEIEVLDKSAARTFKKRVDNLINANGHNHYPFEPRLEGKQDWLKGKEGREVLHSIYFRGPERYSGLNVVVVGGGASGRDAAIQISRSAKKVYHSLNSNSTFGAIPPAITKPRISRFNSTSIIFEDGTSISDIDTVLLATGYWNKIPFLSNRPNGPIRIGSHEFNETVSSTFEKLKSNDKYIRPLHQQTISLSSQHPFGVLSFIGLPINIANSPSDYAQGLLAAWAIAKPDIFGSREDLVADLRKAENDRLRKGENVAKYGHYIFNQSASSDYQDDLISFLRSKNVPLPPHLSHPYVEPWRRSARDDAELLRKGWKRVVEKGEGEIGKWVGGAESERDWVEVMDRLREWERKEETKA